MTIKKAESDQRLSKSFEKSLEAYLLRAKVRLVATSQVFETLAKEDG